LKDNAHSLWPIYVVCIDESDPRFSCLTPTTIAIHRRCSNLTCARYLHSFAPRHRTIPSSSPLICALAVKFTGRNNNFIWWMRPKFRMAEQRLNVMKMSWMRWNYERVFIKF
jgi:hypothetical protein